MKTILQLAIAGLVVFACVRAGEAQWRFYQFKDAVEQEAKFGHKTTVAELQQRVVAIAGDYGIDIDPADVTVARDGEQTTVSAMYLDYIELVPRVYTREHLFELEVSVRPARPLTPDDLK